MMIGEDPVGRPSTNGCSLVGQKALILSVFPVSSFTSETGMKLTNDVLCDIGRSRIGRVSDDESHLDRFCVYVCCEWNSSCDVLNVDVLVMLFVVVDDRQRVIIRWGKRY